MDPPHYRLPQGKVTVAGKEFFADEGSFSSSLHPVDFTCLYTYFADLQWPVMVCNLTYPSFVIPVTVEYNRAVCV